MSLLLSDEIGRGDNSDEVNAFLESWSMLSETASSVGNCFDQAIHLVLDAVLIESVFSKGVWRNMHNPLINHPDLE